MIEGDGREAGLSNSFPQRFKLSTAHSPFSAQSTQALDQIAYWRLLETSLTEHRQNFHNVISIETDRLIALFGGRYADANEIMKAVLRENIICFSYTHGVVGLSHINGYSQVICLSDSPERILFSLSDAVINYMDVLGGRVAEHFILNPTKQYPEQSMIEHNATVLLYLFLSRTASDALEIRIAELHSEMVMPDSIGTTFKPFGRYITRCLKRVNEYGLITVANKPEVIEREGPRKVVKIRIEVLSDQRRLAGFG